MVKDNSYRSTPMNDAVGSDGTAVTNISYDKKPVYPMFLIFLLFNMKKIIIEKKYFIITGVIMKLLMIEIQR